MKDQTEANLADIPSGIKGEPEENQTTSNSSADEIKTEPFEEQASSSSMSINDDFRLPINSVSVIIKSENEEEGNIAKINGSGEKASNSPPIKIEIDIKSESEDGEISSSSSKAVESCDIVVKKENVNNTVKTENQNANVEHNISNSTSTFPLDNSGHINPPPNGNVIAKILTTSIPSTLASCSSSDCNGTDDVSSSDDPQKPACRYGKSCYRLNEMHRKNFSHPPGSDPLESSEKPRCKYGSRCYRKNEEHRKRFIHERSPDNAMSNIRKRKVRNVASQTTGHVYESDSDDDLYLYEEYDGTSDEFNPDDDETDSDETDFDDDSDEQILLNIA